MQGPGSISVVLALSLAVSACSSTASLPTLPPPQPKILPQVPPQAGSGDAGQAPIETAVVVTGTPTSVYAQVAHGALGCWFGADGPLKPTHVFQAEAESPTKGGAAEIVIHERDEALRDKRGPRAYRVSFASEAAGVRVGIAMIRMEPQLAQAMAKDIEVWARGGSGCQLRRLVPPQPVTPVVGPVIGKGDAGRSAGKKR